MWNLIDHIHRLAQLAVRASPAIAATLAKMMRNLRAKARRRFGSISLTTANNTAAKLGRPPQLATSVCEIGGLATAAGLLIIFTQPQLSRTRYRRKHLRYSICVLIIDVDA